MKKRILAVALCVFISIALSGCDFFTADNEDLLHVPQLTGDLYPIEQALKKSVDGEYKLVYPSSLEQRSALLLEDINGDGTDEALIFYSTSNDDLITMNLNVIARDGKEWKSVATQSVIASGIEKVELCDLDNDNRPEIIVGWEILTQNTKQLSVYSFRKNMLSPILIQPYTSFVCCDMNHDRSDELFIHHLNTADALNAAAVYSFSEGKALQIAGCTMDKGVKEARELILSTLSNGTTAIYIDEIKGVSAITEVLYMQNNQLLNPLLDTTVSMENLITARPATAFCKDINEDGILEIPVGQELVNADFGSSEKLYYINWCSFDGTSLAKKDVRIINSADGYMLDIPENWVGNIAVYKDIDNHTRTVYAYDPETMQAAAKIITYRSVSEKEWDKPSFNKNSFKEIMRANGNVYCYQLANYSGELSISDKTAKAMFSLVN